MILKNSVLASFLFVFLVGTSICRGQDYPLPTEWSTHYVWFLNANPDYVRGSDEVESTLTAAHIQYQLGLNADGKAIAAGGFAPVSGDKAVGLTILRAESLAEAQALADADPAVQAGRLLALVREWWVPTDQLH